MTRALVAGATGHVGSRLVRALAERGVDVRAVSPSGGEGVTAGDVADRDSMLALLSGVDAAYYLVHSLRLVGEFGDEEGRAASTFAAASRDCGVGQLVYLGGVPERARLAANLLESLRHGTAVEDDSALRDFDVRPLALSEAVAEALA